MKTTKNHMGLKLKELAYDKKIKAREIAERMNLTTQGIYNIYTRQTVGNDVLMKYCEAVGASMNDVFEFDYPSNKDTFNSSEQVMILQKQNDDLQKLIAQQAATIAQLAQSNQALIEQLGKSEASEMLAVAYA